MPLPLLIPTASWFRVDVVATANVASRTGVGGAIDGITITPNMKILLTAQSTPSQNGVWVAKTAAPWVQSGFANSGSLDRFFEVTQGTAYTGSLWSIHGSIDWGTDAVTVNPISLKTSAAAITGVLPVANGGTGTSQAKFVSSIIVGTGAPQSTPHGLGSTPTSVYAALTDALVGGSAVVPGAHNSTDVIFTATAGASYQVTATL